VPYHFPCTIPSRIKLENHYDTKDLATVLDQNIVKFSARASRPPQEIKPDFFRDEFGVVWNRTVDKDIGAVEEFFLKDRSLKGFQFPNPHDPNRSAAMQAFTETHKERFRLFSLSFSLFERAWILRGMEDLLVDMLEAPDSWTSFWMPSWNMIWLCWTMCSSVISMEFPSETTGGSKTGCCLGRVYGVVSSNPGLHNFTL